ncbi:hypothetical protein L7F22_035687 [Adiantum nelumboides]|nr:hypothetical protein [Adiantum nelumboides]
MALILLQAPYSTEEDDSMMEGEEVLEEVLELQIISLHAVVVDGRQFLFLDDISKTLRLREDESLSVLAIYVGMKDPSGKDEKTQFQIDFEDQSTSGGPSFLPTENEQTLVQTMVSTLVEIKSCASFYKGILESTFHPHKPLISTGKDDHSSIDLTKKTLEEMDEDTEVRFNVDGLYVEEYKKNGKLIAQGKKVGRMFTLDVNILELNAVMFAHGSGVVADIEIWHKRIGHANVQRLKTMQSQELVTGLLVFKVAVMQKVCEACQFEKQAKASFPHDKHVSRNVLELVHSDVWGPTKTASMGGCRFYVTFTDDHTCRVWVYFMKEKSEVFSQFQNFKAMAEKQTGKYVQCLRSDGGGQYFSNEFSSFLKKHGIQRQFTCRYTP